MQPKWEAPPRPLAAEREMDEMMFWYGDGGWAFWQVALMSVGMLAFWGLLIWAIYAIATGSGTRATRDDSGQPARILDERLARGEIDADEYGRVKALLTVGGSKRRSGSAGRS